MNSFFLDNETLMSSRIVLGESFSSELPVALFEVPDIQGSGTKYVVGQNGNEFLIALKNPDWPAKEIIVIENWFEELKERGPVP